MNDTNDLGPGITDSLRDVGSSFKEMVQSEIRLAKAELQDAVENVTTHFFQVALFGAMAVLGIFPLMAFLVIGLGRIFGDNYWLSSLVVSVVFFGVGGALAWRAYRAIKLEGLSLPKTRSTLESEMSSVAESLGKNVVSIEKSFKRRTL